LEAIVPQVKVGLSSPYIINSWAEFGKKPKYTMNNSIF